MNYNKEYKLIKDFEMEIVAAKLEDEEKKMKEKKLSYLSEKEALAKYKMFEI